MLIRRVVLAAAVVLLAGTGPVSATRGHGVFLPKVRGAARPMRNATESSLNWSGYAVTGSGITNVHGEWTVPTVNATYPGFSSTWVGIGGYSSSDLIQAGTEHDSTGGTDYYAWYEILPASESPI